MKHSVSPKPDLDAERFKEHFHTTFEILYFVRGDAYFMLQHTLYRLEPGSLLVTKPGEYHNIVFRSEAPYERYVLRFDPASLSENLRQQLAETGPVYHIGGSPLAEEFSRIDHRLADIHPDLWLDVCIGSATLLLALLAGAVNLIRPADYVNTEAQRILEYIDGHLAEIHNAEALTSALHISKSALYKLFAAQIDTPLMSYVRTQQCIAARALMDAGLSATEAALRLGFNHYSSFYRDYRRVFGEPPSGGSKQ